ncbi:MULTISPECIES: hypothetical protein [unclassified Iodidimonas]|jgi:hypothetical protein|uniref:hypothetical protein n=1 Tax=unclassified Iodidimonas TaxID=2626145 RepID=UPI002482D559|nr:MULTISPECIES: hypothetical protein [unclassified Iodidimonas]
MPLPYKQVLTHPLVILGLLVGLGGYGVGYFTNPDKTQDQKAEGGDDKESALPSDNSYLEMGQLVIPVHDLNNEVKAFLLAEISLGASSTESAGFLLRHMPRVRHEALAGFMQLAARGVFDLQNAQQPDLLSEFLRRDMNSRLGAEHIASVHFSRLMLQPRPS